MDKQIVPLEKLKKHQQERLEIEISRLKQMIIDIQDNINALHDERQTNQQNKVMYIQSFYRRLKEARSFSSNVFYELDIETTKFNVRDREIVEEIENNMNELEQVEREKEKLQLELKNTIIKLEKYHFIKREIA